MSELFILQNHEKLFLNKQNAWVDGRDLNVLFKSAHKDEAINQMFEVSSKDYKQRIKVVPCSANEKGLPLIAAELLPDPLPKAGQDLFEVLDAEPAPLVNTNQAITVAVEDDIAIESQRESLR